MNHKHHERDEQDDAFEHDLRRSLCALAADCAAGPSADAVLARLHRRTERRRIAAVATCAAAAIALSIVALQEPAARPGTPASKQATGPMKQVDLVKVPALPRRESVAAVSSLINLRGQEAPGEPGERDLIAIAATQAFDLDWNLSLTLSLASHLNEESSWPSLRFDSPAWR